MLDDDVVLRLRLLVRWRRRLGCRRDGRQGVRGDGGDGRAAPHCEPLSIGTHSDESVNALHSAQTTVLLRPNSVGANPAQSPDSTFGYGAASTGYNTANVYKYVKGDQIAGATKSSGTTNYTITYLYNINPGTPAGLYTYTQQLVVTATF